MLKLRFNCTDHIFISNYFLSFVATDGKDRNGVKLEKIGQIIENQRQSLKLSIDDIPLSFTGRLLVVRFSLVSQRSRMDTKLGRERRKGLGQDETVARLALGRVVQSRVKLTQG